MRDSAPRITNSDGSSSISVSRGGSSASSSDVVAYASNFLGVPYVWEEHLLQVLIVQV